MSRGVGRAAAVWPLVLGPLLLTAGRGQPPPAVPLTLISPHRDEVREEVGWAFPDWFEARARDRAAAARQALSTWLDGRDDPAPVRAAFAPLLADWSDEDCGPVK